MKVKYRPFDELWANVQTYHAGFRDEYIPRLRELAGTEIDVILSVPGSAPIQEAECGLPLFHVVGTSARVCAHLCEID